MAGEQMFFAERIVVRVHGGQSLTRYVSSCLLNRPGVTSPKQRPHSNARIMAPCTVMAARARTAVVDR